MSLEIAEAHDELLPVARTLFLEYAASLNFELCFQGFDAELAGLPGDYAPPRGCMLVALLDSQPAGCIALRPLDAVTAEVKRLYVRPAFQRQGIGRALTAAVIEFARECGYHALRLDTVSSMTAAMQLYRSAGFYSIGPYCQNPLPGAQFFEKRLTD